MATITHMAREYRDILLSAHRNVRLFFIASFLAQINQGIFGILYNLYIKSLGLPDTVAGSYVSAGAIAGAISLVPAGIISDRFGRKRVVISAALVGGVIAGLQTFVHSPLLIVVAAFCAGMVGSVIWVSVLPLLAENTRKEERLHLFSVNFTVGLLAQVLGSLLAGGLAQELQGIGVGTIWAIRATLLMGALLSILAVIPFSKIQQNKNLQTESVESETKPARPGFAQMLRDAKSDKPQLVLIGKFTLVSALIGFGAGLVIPYLNLYFVERFHMPKATVGLVIGLAQSLTAVAMFVGPATAKRLGPVRAVMTFQLTSIPFLLITGWVMNPLLASVAVIVRNALMNSSSPIQDSVMMALVSEKLRGFAVSCGQTAWTLGWAIMGPISTEIVHRHGSYTGYAMVFTGTAILYLVGSFYYGYAFKKHEAQVYAG